MRDDPTEHADLSLLDEMQELVELQSDEYHRPFIEFVCVDAVVELVDKCLYDIGVLLVADNVG